MKLAILGTRGIPNNYGGFEQFAEYISVGLVNKGHDVTVYNPHFHKYNMPEFKGVKIIKMNSPEKLFGAAANFIYDYNCLKDAKRRNFDIIYEAGYATCSPFFYLLKSTNTKLITNMDGLEWKRSKWGYFTKKLMKRLERNAVKKSEYIISDNKGIQEYYKEMYEKDSFCVAYGSDISLDNDIRHIEKFSVQRENYFMLIARLEPENNIELILNAYVKSAREEPFLVIGDNSTKYGKWLQKRFNYMQIKFCGSIYDKKVLDALRFYCKAYLHGHSVGGTNPSLLEAMGSSAFIIAHKNAFNIAVLKTNALFFSSIEELKNIYINLDINYTYKKEQFLNKNLEEIEKHYNWQYIINKHEEIFQKIYANR
ncbi:DUF1972 domain-containing protein [Parafilimonas terrae]|uniref:Glycosyltransferase involved in cell wall bisynthesis n=1 Tax=Parafilimonas terrae TaxID=1465490 RepID=A0A1I5X3W1_9BACT|nr:DUF1972 domain-containing protein [Parafilimonas terrae]SFQ26659.1 Glycosyltransferase involved in cell wall bisynthesis [Parafilimonas terrae]